jgi:hypothetical protein
MEWKLTDPDNFQYGRKVNENIYQFQEFDRNNYPLEFKQLKEGLFGVDYFEDDKYWVEEEIDLQDYTMDEITSHISNYGYSLYPASSFYINKIYPDLEEVKWVIAECIFEQTNLY